MKKIILFITLLSISPKLFAQYCVPSYTMYTSSASPLGAMSEFQFNGYSGYYLDDTTPRTGYGSGYINNTTTATDTIPMKQGGSYAGTITYGSAAGYTGSQIWIDFNDNGAFEGTEAVSSVAPNYWVPGSTPITYNDVTVNIPVSATTGYHRMRVRNVWYELFIHGTTSGCVCALNSSLDPCNDSDAVNLYWSGVTVDYTANIIAGCSFTMSPSSSSPVCVGGNLNLFGTFTFGSAVTYSWSGPGGFTSTMQNPMLTGVTTAQAGVYTFTASDTTCTVSDTTTVVITNPGATVTVTDSVCSGNTGIVSFSGAPGTVVYYKINGGTTLNVTIPASGTRNISTGTLTTGSTPSTTTYSLVSAQIGFCSQSISGSASVTIVPKPTPISGGSAPLCMGMTVTLTDADTGGTWSTSNNAIATVSSSGASCLVTGLGLGGVNIFYTNNITGCKVLAGFTVNPVPGVITGPTAVCQGSTITLSDTSTDGTWSVNDNSIATINTTGVLTGVSGSTVVSSYTLATGCYSTYSVVVNPLPPAITGSTSICLNTISNLSNTFTGGTWSSSDNSVATVVRTTGAVTGVAVNTATITFTSSAGCTTTTPIRVIALPAAIVGASSVCMGFTTRLSDAAGGTWLSNAISIATIGGSTGIVTGVTNGTTTITFTDGTTGCQITAPMTVNLNPSVITGTTRICESGGVTTLSDSLAGGTWSSGNPGTASVDPSTGVVTGGATGTTTITYNVLGCTATVSIFASEQPGAIITPIGDTMLCPGDFVVLTGNTGTGYSYQWFAGSTPIAGATDNFYVSDTTQNYTLSVTGPLGCISNSVPMAVTLHPITASVTTTSATTFCPGLSATLTGDAGSGITYQWLHDGTGIAGATSLNYFATAAGDFSVIESNPFGCTSTSPSIAITLLDAPVSTLTLSGSTTFCNRDSLLLTANTATGITYQWLMNGANIAGATNQTYIARVTGNFQVVETNTLTCTNASTVAAVNVLALPPTGVTASGPLAFCTGGNVNLSTTSSGGTTYQWYNNGIIIPGATTPAYDAFAGGNYAVKVTAATGCTDITSPPIYVDEITIPVVVPYSSTHFCWGGSSLLGLSVSSTSGVTFQWQLNGSNIAGATANIYVATIPGNYSCIVNIAAGCTASTEPAVVTENPLPNPIISYSSGILATAPYYTIYQWYRDLVAIPGATSSTYIPNSIGDYTVKVVDTNGCQSVATTYILRSVQDPRTLGLYSTTDPIVTIYPNPAQNTVHIAASEPVNAVINALDGRTVISQNNVADIDISRLSDGVYVILVYNRSGLLVKMEKLVKE